jgi:pyruvate,orthophosphate dikinase
MMDTVLNLGINDEVVEVMKNITHNERFALDTYRRFLQMFGTVVLSKEKELYEGKACVITIKNCIEGV